MFKSIAGLMIAAILMGGSSVAAQSDNSSTWVKHTDPVFVGQFFVASDPTVIREDNLYRMYYTCMDFLRESPRAILCQATSTDGFTWENIPAEGQIEGLVLRGREGTWEEDLEGAFAIKFNNEYLLYYSGYRDDSNTPAKGYPAALGLAISTDGLTFERHADDPILVPTAGWYDSNAIYSEVILEYEGQLVMIYVGHCYIDCENRPGTTLLAATSSDGRNWTKRPDPILTAMEDIDWTRDGVAEPAIVPDPNGGYVLFFTGVRDEDRWIGMAHGDSPFGPWEVTPEPIITPTPNTFDAAGTLAPHVIIEDSLARMWYLGMENVPGGQYIAIGYAEASWPSK